MNHNKIQYETMLTRATDVISCLLDLEGGHTILTFVYAILKECIGSENVDAADIVIRELCYMTGVPFESSDEENAADRLCWQELFLDVTDAVQGNA